jgi:hypothetical protein
MQKGSRTLGSRELTLTKEKKIIEKRGLIAKLKLSKSEHWKSLSRLLKRLKTLNH